MSASTLPMTQMISAPTQMMAPGVYGGSGSYAPGVATQAYTTQTMQAPMAIPQQQFSYAPAPQPQSPRGFASYGGSGGFPVGGGSGRFAAGGFQQGAAIPTWNQAPAMPQGGSYTAPAPQMQGNVGNLQLQGASSQGMQLGGNRGQGTSLQGMPTPPQIVAQQTRYAAALDQQLSTGVATLEKERDLEKQMLKFTCEKDIALFTNAATEKFVEQSELVDERTTFAILELKKAAVERKLQLDAQANGLTLDYEMKSVQVEWQKKWNAFEAQFQGAENKLEAQFAAQEAIAHSGTSYAAPVPVLR